MAWFFFAGLAVMVGLQLSSGRIATRGRSIERTRNPKGFWIGIAFEIVMLVALAVGLITGLAR
jgi:hypothetical protein